MKLPGGKLLYIKWIDSTGWSRWLHVDTLKENILNDFLECESIGWLVHEDKISIVIAPHRSANSNIDGIMRIPKIAITDMWEITF